MNLQLSQHRVAIIDDDSQTRDTFHLAFPRLKVVGTYPDVESFLAASPQVDLAVLDLVLSTTPAGDGQLQGPRAIREIVQAGYPVSLYTDERRLLVITLCLSAGATSLIRKCDRVADNQLAFLRTLHGEVVLPTSLVGLAQILSRRDCIPDLTPRQRQVLSARARGETWEALGRRLGISPKTAQDHLDAVMRKMVWYLTDAGLRPDASPADIERALGIAPDDLDPA